MISTVGASESFSKLKFVDDLFPTLSVTSITTKPLVDSKFLISAAAKDSCAIPPFIDSVEICFEPSFADTDFTPLPVPSDTRTSIGKSSSPFNKSVPVGLIIASIVGLSTSIFITSVS